MSLENQKKSEVNKKEMINKIEKEKNKTEQERKD